MVATSLSRRRHTSTLGKSMKENIEFTDRELSILFNFDEGVVVFRNFRVEDLVPKKYTELSIGFEEIGMNTFSHFGAGSQPPINDTHALLTLKGRVWISEDFKDFDEAINLFDTLWEQNSENRNKKELREFKSELSKTHPVTKIVGIIILVLIAAGVIYYFTNILPNIEV